MDTCKAVAHLRDFAQVTYNYQQVPLGSCFCFCRSCLQWNKQTSALYIILSKTNKVLFPPYNDVIVSYIRIILCDFLWIFPLCRSTMAWFPTLRIINKRPSSAICRQAEMISYGAVRFGNAMVHLSICTKRGCTYSWKKGAHATYFQAGAVILAILPSYPLGVVNRMVCKIFIWL